MRKKSAAATNFFHYSSSSYMASENFVQPAIPRFDGHYDHWSMHMENFLRSKEYWQIVEVGVEELAAGTVLMDQQRTDLEGQS